MALEKVKKKTTKAAQSRIQESQKNGLGDLKIMGRRRIDDLAVPR
jgi:hypothetical protein